MSLCVSCTVLFTYRVKNRSISQVAHVFNQMKNKKIYTVLNLSQTKR